MKAENSGMGSNAYADLTLDSKDCIGIIYDSPTQRNNSSAGQKDAQIANGGKHGV